MGLEQDPTSVHTDSFPPALILAGSSSERKGGCNPPPCLLLVLFLNKLQAGWGLGEFLAALWLLELGVSLSQGPALQAATIGVPSQELTQEKEPGGTF